MVWTEIVREKMTNAAASVACRRLKGLARAVMHAASHASLRAYKNAHIWRKHTLNCASHLKMQHAALTVNFTLVLKSGCIFFVFTGVVLESLFLPNCSQEYAWSVSAAFGNLLSRSAPHMVGHVTGPALNIAAHLSAAAEALATGMS